MKWNRLAADSGHVAAAYAVGVLYLGAQGIQRNPKEALKWFTIATALSRDHDEQVNCDDALSGQIASSRDGLISQLTPEVIKQAEQEAAEWMAAFSLHSR